MRFSSPRIVSAATLGVIVAVAAVAIYIPTTARSQPGPQGGGGGCGFSMNLLNATYRELVVAAGAPTLLVVQPIVDCRDWLRDEYMTVSASVWRLGDDEEDDEDDEYLGYFVTEGGGFRTPSGTINTGADVIKLDLPPGEYHMAVGLHRPGERAHPDFCHEAQEDLGGLTSLRQLSVTVQGGR